MTQFYTNICAEIREPTIDCQLQPGAHLPQRAHPTDAGADLRALEAHEIYPRRTKTC